MDTKDMIKVMMDYLDGYTIMFSPKNYETDWTVTTEPFWDWTTFDYKAVKPPSNKVVFVRFANNQPYAVSAGPMPEHWKDGGYDYYRFVYSPE